MSRLLFASALTLLASFTLAADDLTTLTVHVASALNGKPIARASVIVRYKPEYGVKVTQTSWETKTNQEGDVTLPEMPRGKVEIQIIASDYQTFGDMFETNKPAETIEIKLNPPQPQYSEDAKSKTVPK